MIPAGVFNDHPDVDKIYTMFALACHPDYRSKGIASQLVKQSLQVLKPRPGTQTAFLAPVTTGSTHRSARFGLAFT